MAFPDEEVQTYLSLLREKAGDCPTEEMNVFIKTQLEIYGTRMPDLHAMGREWARANKKEPMGRTLELCGALWKVPMYDARMLAISILRMMPTRLDIEVINAVEQWYGDMDNWAHCDALSCYVVGVAVLRHPEYLDHTSKWLSSKNPWKRRASLLAPMMLYRKLKLEPEYSFEQLIKVKDDQEHYVKKTFEWVLREIGRKYPEKLYDFLMVNCTNYTKSQLRESIKYLSHEQKEDILQCYITSS